MPTNISAPRNIPYAGASRPNPLAAPAPAWATQRPQQMQQMMPQPFIHSFHPQTGQPMAAPGVPLQPSAKQPPVPNMMTQQKPPAAASPSAPSHSVHSNMALYLNQFGKNSAPQPQQLQGQPSMSSFMK